MFKGITIFLAAWALEAGAQQIKKVPIQPTPAASGTAMFHEYCASCHGSDGKGYGPAAAALKKRPADLTQLARKNGGSFPEARVINLITGNDVIVAHGTRDMPVWGELFWSLGPHDERLVRLRMENLAQYIKSIQAR
jgi:mono/diheme cytochrome c family protein